MGGMDGLYELQGTLESGSVQSTTKVVLNAEHAIFQGHFPGQPVLPGVCMVQIAIRIASAMRGEALRMREARSVKFLAPVDPRTAPVLEYRTVLTEKERAWHADVQALAGDAVVLKLNAELVP